MRPFHDVCPFSDPLNLFYPPLSNAAGASGFDRTSVSCFLGSALSLPFLALSPVFLYQQFSLDQFSSAKPPLEQDALGYYPDLAFGCSAGGGVCRGGWGGSRVKLPFVGHGQFGQQTSFLAPRFIHKVAPPPMLFFEPSSLGTFPVKIPNEKSSSRNCDDHLVSVCFVS